MATLDEDAAQVVGLLAARGFAIEKMTPAEIRGLMAAAPRMPGRDVYEVRAVVIPVQGGRIAGRVYRPSAAFGLPVLVWFHGGGMVIGDLESADWVCRELCVLAGHVVVSVDYRLAPEHKFPTAVEDAYAALRWVCDSAAEFAGDPTRVSVGGDSAGGTCATVACLMAAERGGPPVLAQLLVYPGVDRDLTTASAVAFADGPLLTREAMLWFRRHYHADEAEFQDWRATPARAGSHRGLPPACVLTAEMDPIRDAGEAYGALLAREGVMVRMKRYRGVFHGFFTIGPMVAKTVEAVGDAARFLRDCARTDG
jgi:acetyl esterase